MRNAQAYWFPGQERAPPDWASPEMKVWNAQKNAPKTSTIVAQSAGSGDRVGPLQMTTWRYPQQECSISRCTEQISLKSLLIIAMIAGANHSIAPFQVICA